MAELDGLDKAGRLAAERRAQAEKDRQERVEEPLNPDWPWEVLPFDAELFLQPQAGED